MDGLHIMNKCIKDLNRHDNRFHPFQRFFTFHSEGEWEILDLKKGWDSLKVFERKGVKFILKRGEIHTKKGWNSLKKGVRKKGWNSCKKGVRFIFSLLYCIVLNCIVLYCIVFFKVWPWKDTRNSLKLDELVPSPWLD